MAQPIAPDYRQQFLLRPALEDWVPADHPARFLREFVDQLDLPALGFAMPSGSQGRRPYAPSLLLKIWLYGYFHRLRSTRKLEVACREHMALLWLTGLIGPDHNSLWRFWDENKKALRQVFKQSVQLAVRTGAVGLVLQALDGTKIEAAASGYSGWSKEYMEKLLATLDKALDQTELALAQENHEADGYRLPAGLAERQALREQVKAGLAQLAADGRNHHHPVEPEARRMKVGGTNRFAYNAQAVVDGKEGVVVACEASRQETDAGQLVPMIEQARENLGAAGAAPTTLADAGYGAGADLQAAQEKQLPVLAPPAEGKPARDCPVRALCTRDPKGRQIEIWPHAPVVQAMRATLQEPWARSLYQQRNQIVERRFGQLKQHDGFRRWTVWGLEAVRTQWSLLCTTLNLRVLYQRWRQHRPDGPKTTAAMTGPTAKGGNGRAALLKKIRWSLDALQLARKRAAHWLFYWPTYGAV